MSAEYPSWRSADVVLRDGTTVEVRPVRADDQEPVQRFLEGLAPTSLTFRFFTGATNLRLAANSMTDVDYRNRYGLVATRGGDERIVGQASYFREDRDRAEVAFAVADELQGRGLATIMLAHLAGVARENGISLFTAEVMPENHRMIEVFRESGFTVETASLPGALHVEFPVSLTDGAVLRFEDRDRMAAQAAVKRFLEPGSIALIGASRQRGTVGGEVFHNLLRGEFDGVVYPVNPAADVVQSVRAYPSVLELPELVELAIVAVPAPAVVDVARECGQAGVRALVVISAGFAESGPEGAARERELVEVCTDAGMRLIGPNCLGILNASEPQFDATFAPALPPGGNVGFVTQSGALGLALIALARDRSLGVSSFASIGNRADITANDLLEYWEQDPATRVALLYIESFSDARRFSRVARRVGREMPIVVVKSGRSAAGARATASHTGALLAASDVRVDALFEQAGVIRTDSLAEMLDVASLLANEPLPAGPRVGIVTNAGGPGIMCADACEAAGLEVPATPEDLRGALREFLPPEAALGNPIDLVATASAEDYRRAIRAMSEWEGIDAVIAIFIRPLLTRAEDVARAIAETAADLPRQVPVQAVFMSAEDQATMASIGGIPSHLYPEDAARALARVMDHVRWRAKPPAEPATFADTDEDRATAVIAWALGEGEEWLTPGEATQLLECHGIATPRSLLAENPAEAAAAARQLGPRVALKAQAPGLLHKSDVGGVAVGLEAGAVEAAAREMDAALAAHGHERESFLVQEMVEGGIELIIGVVDDPIFGPAVACGAGGVEAELLRDVAVRLSPLTARDATEMLESLALFPRLTGYRGAQPADLAAIEEMVLRVGAMVESHSEIAELDLNPVIARADGAVAVDARVRVRSAPPRAPWPSTWRTRAPRAGV